MLSGYLLAGPITNPSPRVTEVARAVHCHPRRSDVVPWTRRTTRRESRSGPAGVEGSSRAMASTMTSRQPPSSVPPRAANGVVLCPHLPIRPITWTRSCRTPASRPCPHLRVTAATVAGETRRIELVPAAVDQAGEVVGGGVLDPAVPRNGARAGIGPFPRGRVRPVICRLLRVKCDGLSRNRKARPADRSDCQSRTRRPPAIGSLELPPATGVRWCRAQRPFVSAERN